MILHLNNFTRELSWNEDSRLNELVIENPRFLRELVKELCSPEDDPQNLSLTDSGGYALNFSNDIEAIVNPLKLDFNNRKIIANLLKILANASLSEDFYLKTNELKANIIRHLGDIMEAENFSFEAEADDFSFGQIAKAINFHIVDDEDDFVEFITNYLEVMREMLKTRLFIFISLRSFLDFDETLRFYQNIRNRDINVLLLENQCRNMIPEANRLIIDNDLCEI